jgi:hypothetical protein
MQKQIRNMSYGALQVSFQNMQQPLQINNITPILFDAWDISRNSTSTESGIARQGCPVYTLQHVQGDASHPVISTRFARAQQNNAFYQYQNDICDGGKFKPVSAEYTLKFDCHNFAKPIRFTIHTFTMKMDAHAPVSINNGANLRHMPNALVNMQHLCSPVTNQLSPEYVKVYTKKEITIMPVAHNAAAAIQNSRFVKLFLKGGKLRVQLDTNPIDMNDPTSEVADGNWGHMNVPSGQPYWMLISSDSYLADNTQVSISRVVKWRDHVGAA